MSAKPFGPGVEPSKQTNWSYAPSREPVAIFSILFTKILNRLRAVMANRPSLVQCQKKMVQFSLGNLTQSRCEERQAASGTAESLEYYLALRGMVDRKINTLCSAHYEGRHPKHFLWTAHNQYLYDAVRAGDRVIDIGCGASHYPQWIAEKAAEVVGVDINPERVEMAQRNNAMANVRFELLDVTRDLPAGRFDLAICSHVLEHLDDPVSLLRTLAQKVPRLVVKVPLVDSDWMKLVKRDLGLFWMDDPDHRREYFPSLLTEQLEEGGWKATEMIRGADLRATAVSKSFHQVQRG